MTENNPQILRHSKQEKGTPSEKEVPFKWSKQKFVCGISVVKREIAVVKPRRFPFLEHRNTIDAEVITLIALTLIRLLQDNVFVIL